MHRIHAHVTPMSVRSALLNLVWLIFGGLGAAVGWGLAAVIMAVTIVGIPWARAAINIAIYTLLPFGQKAVPRDLYTGGGIPVPVFSARSAMLSGWCSRVGGSPLSTCWPQSSLASPSLVFRLHGRTSSLPGLHCGPSARWSYSPAKYLRAIRSGDRKHSRDESALNFSAPPPAAHAKLGRPRATSQGYWIIFCMISKS